MLKKFVYEYWRDDEWWVGRICELEGVFSQGKSLEELEENLKEAFYLMQQEGILVSTNSQIRELRVSLILNNLLPMIILSLLTHAKNQSPQPPRGTLKSFI